MSAAAWIVALLAAYPHLAHRPCIVARASQIAADADSAAARFGVCRRGAHAGYGPDDVWRVRARVEGAL